VHARAGEADLVAGRRARRPAGRRAAVAVEEELDVDLGPVRALAADREVAPVLLALAAREAPAELRENQLLARGGPAQRDDLARLLDAQLGELRRGERDGGHPRARRCHPHDLGEPGVEREGPAGLVRVRLAH
jgi:hypothetical protein